MSTETARPMAELRARKAGIALKIQRKQEERYDAESMMGTPDAIVDWINVVLEKEHPELKFDKKKGVPWRAMQDHLKDGVAICKLLNKLLKADGKPPIKFTAKADTAFVCMANIETFTEAVQTYGVAESEIFQSIDLYEGYKGPLITFINCLNKLGTLANKKGFTPTYEEVSAPTRDDRWDET